MLELKQIAGCQQAGMIKSVFSGKNCTEGESLTRVSIVSNGYLVGFTVIADGVNTRNFLVADALDEQLVRLVVVTSINMSVVPTGCSLLPGSLAVDVVDNLFGKSNGCSRRSIELMYVVSLLKFDVILWKLVHDLSQIAVDS